MIIQCEKCKTRFKLDDSRVTEAGIRVRCSRCSHTFVVRRESPEEESDFESILQGFGGNEFPEEDEEHDFPEDGFTADQSTQEGSLPQDAELGTGASSSGAALADRDDTADSLSWDEGDQESESFSGESREEAAEEKATPVQPETQEPPFSEVLRKNVGLPHFQGSPDFDPSEKITTTKDDAEDFGLASLFERAPVHDSQLPDEDSADPASLAPDSPTDPVEPQKPESTSSIRERLWPVADSKDEEELAEELSPLSISSRRKSSPFRPILLAVLLILLLGVGGYYLYSQHAGQMVEMLPESVKSLVGPGKKAGGLVEIRSLEGTFLANRDAGEIFVMTGEAFNISSMPLTTMQVKGKVYGPDGEVLAQQTVFCGNVLSGEQLAMQPYSSMVKVLSKQFGETLANFEVQPGKGIPFAIVFKDVPRGAKDFGAEVVSPVETNGR
ncbi:MAG: DUF3426 domain-containing protein [Deltaproteobacteria bacterium]|nr:DUF3426 domain-containing protein [Deltaproteobacteria bacterium]TLN01146.1 MAG: DUF3426 domain-containing protein [bacterium]